MGRGWLVFCLALLWAVNGLRITHNEQTAPQKKLSSSQLQLNGSKLAGGAPSEPDRSVNWTKLNEQDGIENQQARDKAARWLAPTGSNSAVVEREVVSKVYTQQTTQTKPTSTALPESLPFAYSNLSANNNWTSFDYSKIQVDDLMKSQSNSTTICPQGQPFYAGDKCLTCTGGAFFDMETKQCGYPTANNLFDPNLHRFVRPQKQMKTRTDAPYLEYNGISLSEYAEKRQQEQANPDEQCPKSAPYYDGIVCVQCVMPYPIFNVETLRCQRCSNGTIYQQEHHGCYLPNSPRQPLSIRQSLGGIIG